MDDTKDPETGDELIARMLRLAKPSVRKVAINGKLYVEQVIHDDERKPEDTEGETIAATTGVPFGH